MKKRKGTIHSVDPVLFQRYLNSQPDHVLATLLCQWAFQPGLKFKASHLWKHFVKWQKTDAALPMLDEGAKMEIVIQPFPRKSPTIAEWKEALEVKPDRNMKIPPGLVYEGLLSAPVKTGPSFEDGV